MTVPLSKPWFDTVSTLYFAPPKKKHNIMICTWFIIALL